MKNLLQVSIQSWRSYELNHDRVQTHWYTINTCCLHTEAVSYTHTHTHDLLTGHTSFYLEPYRFTFPVIKTGFLCKHISPRVRARFGQQIPHRLHSRTFRLNVSSRLMNKVCFFSPYSGSWPWAENTLRPKNTEIKTFGSDGGTESKHRICTVMQSVSSGSFKNKYVNKINK